MNTSRIPAAVDQLVTTTRAALPSIDVFDGPGLTDAAPASAVFIGVSESEPRAEQASSQAEQRWATTGKTRDETFTIRCLAVARDGDGDVKAARDLAFAHVAAVETAIRTDPAMADVILYAAVQVTRHTTAHTASGAKVCVFFDVTCRARI